MDRSPVRVRYRVPCGANNRCRCQSVLSVETCILPSQEDTATLKKQRRSLQDSNVKEKKSWTPKGFKNERANILDT